MESPIVQPAFCTPSTTASSSASCASESVNVYVPALLNFMPEKSTVWPSLPVIAPFVARDSACASPARSSDTVRSPAAIFACMSDVAASVNENSLSVLSVPETFFVTCGVSSSLASVL